jgi:hypothetical protein
VVDEGCGADRGIGVSDRGLSPEDAGDRLVPNAEERHIVFKEYIGYD